MKKYYSAAIVATVILISACGPATKQATQSPDPVSNSGESKSEPNPTLNKLTAKMIDNNTFQLEGYSQDSTYGYSASNAIKVGGGESGPVNERRFLNALLGPGGETVTYHRIGSCCAVESKNGFMGMAMLDKYEVKYDGINKPVILYINMDDPGTLKAPLGFTFKRE